MTTLKLSDNMVTIALDRPAHATSPNGTRFNLQKGAKLCATCRAPIMAPELAPSEPERCERCAD